MLGSNRTKWGPKVEFAIELVATLDLYSLHYGPRTKDLEVELRRGQLD